MCYGFTFKVKCPNMSVMLKQQLSQKMLQKLSPQQIQLMKLLQIPTAALDQRIKEELEANPALEEGTDEEERMQDENDSKSEDEEVSIEDQEYAQDKEDNYELDDYLSSYMEDDPSVYYNPSSNKSEEDNKMGAPVEVYNSFHEHLLRQMGLLKLKDETEIIIAHQILGSIDDDGYLRRDPLSIIDDLMFSTGEIVEEKDIINVLQEVQKLDPIGVGARDLKECLLLQLKSKINNSKKEGKALNNNLLRAYLIIQDHFEEFSKKHYHKLTKYFEIEENELKDAIDEILKLNPKPASGYSGDKSNSTNYILPDFIITNRDGELELTLNSRNAPDLRINDYYQEMLKAYSKPKHNGDKEYKKDKDAVMFIRQKIDSARWFIDAIVKRQNTMYKTMYAIMQFQYEYFLTGDDRKLRPMILKDISDITGLDISTVSRVANSKFVQTEFGTRRIKDFFSESLQTQDGEEVSTLEVKKILTDIIEDEDKRKPLSDEDLKELLKEKGYSIARRTVAKYREQLNIPVARLRKEL